jgi:hypothetical protein
MTGSAGGTSRDEALPVRCVRQDAHVTSTWRAQHSWAGAILDLAVSTTGGVLGPGDRHPMLRSPYFSAVLEPDADAEQVHRSLVSARKQRQDRATCWVGNTARLQQGRQVSRSSGAVAGPDVRLLQYKPVDADLHTQLLGIPLLEGIAGMVVLVPMYSHTVTVTPLVSIGESPDVFSMLLTPAGHDFPAESKDSQPVLTAWALDRHGVSAMLATRLLPAAAGVWRIDLEYTDLVEDLERLDTPLAFSRGAAAIPELVLRASFGLTSDTSRGTSTEAIEFPVTQALGRYALASAVMIRTGDLDPSQVHTLEEMTDPLWGQDLIDGGWPAVLAEQLTSKRLGPIFSIDEGRFLPPELAADLLRLRSRPQHELWRMLRLAAPPGKPAELGPQPFVELLTRIFAAHPNWVEPKP